MGMAELLCEGPTEYGPRGCFLAVGVLGMLGGWLLRRSAVGMRHSGPCTRFVPLASLEVEVGRVHRWRARLRWEGDLTPVRRSLPSFLTLSGRPRSVDSWFYSEGVVEGLSSAEVGVALRRHGDDEVLASSISEKCKVTRSDNDKTRPTRGRELITLKYLEPFALRGSRYVRLPHRPPPIHNLTGRQRPRADRTSCQTSASLYTFLKGYLHRDNLDAVMPNIKTPSQPPEMCRPPRPGSPIDWSLGGGGRRNVNKSTSDV